MAHSNDSTQTPARRERVDLRIKADQRKRYETVLAQLNAAAHKPGGRGYWLIDGRFVRELTLSDFLRVAADEACERFEAATSAPKRVRTKAIAKVRTNRGGK
jgi:hypothetical protein